MDFQTKMSLMGLCPNSSPCSDTGYLKCVKEDNGWALTHAFAYQDLRKVLIEKEHDCYIQGQVDMMFDIAMDWIRQKYAKDKYRYHEMKTHIEFCLSDCMTRGMSDIDYEIWCMMACIVGIK